MGQQQMIILSGAAVIACLLLFTLFGVQQRTRDASIDAVQYRAAKQNMLNVVEMVQYDLRNVGAHMYRNASGNYVGETMSPQDVIEYGWYSSTANGSGHFKFLAQPDSLSPPDSIRYAWKPNGETVTLRDGTVRPLITLERFVGGTLTGWSDRFTVVSFTLHQPESMPIMVNLWDARAIEVSLRAVSPLGKAETIEETRFDATYRPVPIAIKDNRVY